MDATAGHARYDAVLGRLAASDPTVRQAAAGELVSLVAERLRYMARRMLRGFPLVRRLAETDDVAQGAALRLHRALAAVSPPGPAEFLGLAALQVRRELIDLARKHAGPESPARHRDTDVIHDRGVAVHRTAQAVDESAAESESLARWVRFHEVAEGLPEDERRVFSMVWYLGLSQDEIAALVDWSPRTVRRRWDSARRLFQERFQGDPPQ